MKTCGLIRQKKVNGMTSISIARDQWIIFISQCQLSNVEIIMSKIGTVIDDKLIRKNLTFIHIGNRSSSSYLNTITQHNHHILPPIIKMRQLSLVFLNSISADILETMHWSVNESISVPVIFKNDPSNSLKSTSTSYENPPILQSMYPILDKLNINTSKLDDKHLDIIFLKNWLSQVSCVLTYNNRGNKELIQIPSVRHLKKIKISIYPLLRNDYVKH